MRCFSGFNVMANREMWQRRCDCEALTWPGRQQASLVADVAAAAAGSVVGQSGAACSHWYIRRRSSGGAQSVARSLGQPMTTGRWRCDLVTTWLACLTVHTMTTTTLNADQSLDWSLTRDDRMKRRRSTWVVHRLDRRTAGARWVSAPDDSCPLVNTNYDIVSCWRTL